MKKKRLLIEKIISIVCTYIICTTDCFAQYADFSQIYNNYVYLNPAFVGTTSCPHAFTSFRTKYLSQGGYNSAYISYDMEMQKSNSSIGFSFLQDFQEKIFRTSDLLAIYAHTFQIQKYLYLRASLAAGYSHRVTNYDGLVFSDMLNVFQENYTATGEDLERYSKHDFNSEMGVLVYNERFFAGMTIKNLQGNVTEMNKNENLFPRIFSFHGLAKFSWTRAYTQQYLIQFYPHINMVFGGTSSYAQMGLILQKWMVQMGSAFRQNFPCNANSLSFFVGIVEKRFRFAYNCDMTINSVKRIDTHEVSLSYQFDCREKKKKFEAFKAPTF
ncbi:MAG: PorP/SprF family type IX secretion system membrane protein [Bacteroidales bacterium]|nr:PorP/SprF family type IX secretion system membrane protein [Bacteroidales bacterium]